MKISRIIIFIVSFILLVNNIGFAETKTKLYRNQDWQFSIKIPVEFEYMESRGPNVIMNSKIINDDSRASINIIAKLIDNEFNFSEIELLQYLQEGRKNAYKNHPNMKLIDSKIFDIPNHKILGEHWLTRHTYPKETFYLESFLFTILCGQKFYTITYAVEPAKLEFYNNKFLESISSFVDETGWY